MSMEAWGNLIGVVTVITMLVFIGIWIWAWRKKHRAVFDRMAAIPMEDPPEGPFHGPAAIPADDHGTDDRRTGKRGTDRQHAGGHKEDRA